MRQLAGRGVPRRQRAARLHRHAGQEILLDRHLHHPGRAAEGAVGIARAPRLAQRAIARRLVEELGRAGRQRRARHGHPAQGLVVHRDQRHRVPGRRRRLGDHRGDRRALGVDPLAGQQRVGRHDHVAEEPVHRQGADGAEVGAGDDGHDARGLPGATHVQPGDAGVGVGAAQQRQVRDAGRREVVHEPAAPGEQRGVLSPPERAADPGHRLRDRGSGRRWHPGSAGAQRPVVRPHPRRRPGRRCPCRRDSRCRSPRGRHRTGRRGIADSSH